MKRVSFRVTILLAPVSLIIFMMVNSRVPTGLQAQQPERALGGVSNEERLAKVSGLILSGLEQRNIPSVSIAVARMGRIIWEQ